MLMPARAVPIHCCLRSHLPIQERPVPFQVTDLVDGDRPMTDASMAGPSFNAPIPLVVTEYRTDAVDGE